MATTPAAMTRFHHTKQFTKRTMFSGWDVLSEVNFRLLTIIAPDVVEGHDQFIGGTGPAKMATPLL